MAGGFDMMRFQKCSDTLIPSIRKNAKWIAFWVFACFVLFLGLGIYPAIRSEARWFEVVREMLMTGDWLHPRINGQAYFDKPLVSYWFAAVVSKLAGGHVTELSVRLPSALFALAGLGCIISVARKFYSERTAYSIGDENLKKPEIQNYLRELMEKMPGALADMQGEDENTAPVAPVAMPPTPR